MNQLSPIFLFCVFGLILKAVQIHGEGLTESVAINNLSLPENEVQGIPCTSKICNGVRRVNAVLTSAGGIDAVQQIEVGVINVNRIVG